MTPLTLEMRDCVGKRGGNGIFSRARKPLCVSLCVCVFFSCGLLHVAVLSNALQLPSQIGRLVGGSSGRFAICWFEARALTPVTHPGRL